MKTGAHIVVRGMVQGVGFRYFVLDRATRLRLKGFVRNNYGGNVEITVEGNRSLIEELIKEVKVGPRLAHVADMKVQWEDLQIHYETFEIR